MNASIELYWYHSTDNTQNIISHTEILQYLWHYSYNSHASEHELSYAILWKFHQVKDLDFVKKYKNSKNFFINWNWNFTIWECENLHSEMLIYTVRQLCNVSQ